MIIIIDIINEYINCSKEMISLNVQLINFR